MENLRIALLIDGDNISSAYIDVILSELGNWGTVTYKRIYGDWSDPRMKSWRDVLLENSITPMQQFPNRKGKNATDTALIIDAMDILYSGNTDAFCIITGDSDFTHLVTRLRESGQFVIGMGSAKNSHSSISKACNIFKYVEVLGEEAEASDTGTQSSFTPVSEIEAAICDLIRANDDDDKVTALAEVGSRLTDRYPDFDTRNYEYTNLSTFIAKSCPNVQLYNESTHLCVRLSGKSDRKNIEVYIRERAQRKGGISLSHLGQDLHGRFPGFSCKSFGYTTLKKYVQDISGLKIDRDNNITVK